LSSKNRIKIAAKSPDDRNKLAAETAGVWQADMVLLKPVDAVMLARLAEQLFDSCE
jgi:hypothetical protein